MRRLARWLVRLFCAMSLILFVAACALWVRAVKMTDMISMPLASAEVVIANGRTGLNVGAGVYDDPAALSEVHFEWQAEPWSPRHGLWIKRLPSFLGFRATKARGTRSDMDGNVYPMSYGFVVLPHWFLAVATFVPPALFTARRLRTWRRRARSLCASCGYDLRATPDRCPECGAVRATATARSTST